MPELDAATSATIKTIAETVSEGKCILFLGAAVHARPPDDSAYTYDETQRPPLGKRFARDLATESQFLDRFPDESDEDLPRVALHYEDYFSRNKLVSEIEKAVHVGKRPSPVVRALAALPFPIIITTNYDELFEQALRDPSVRKDPHVVVYRAEQNKGTTIRSEFNAESPLVLKIHGDVSNIDDIVITDEDYIQFIMRMGDKDPYNPVPLPVRSSFTMWPTLFVGYSLVDYNLRLLFKTLRWNIDPASIPDAYSVDVSPDPLIMAIWQDRRKYIRYIKQDVWDFVPELYKRATGKEMPV